MKCGEIQGHFRSHILLYIIQVIIFQCSLSILEGNRLSQAQTAVMVRKEQGGRLLGVGRRE